MAFATPPLAVLRATCRKVGSAGDGCTRMTASATGEAEEREKG